MLQEGSENLPPATVKEFKPDLKKHNKKEFHHEYVYMVPQYIHNTCDSVI